MRLRRIEATRYVTPLREGGSQPALVELDPTLAVAEPDREIQDLAARLESLFASLVAT